MVIAKNWINQRTKIKWQRWEKNSYLSAWPRASSNEVFSSFPVLNGCERWKRTCCWSRNILMYVNFCRNSKEKMGRRKKVEKIANETGSIKCESLPVVHRSTFFFIFHTTTIWMVHSRLVNCCYKHRPWFIFEKKK